MSVEFDFIAKNTREKVLIYPFFNSGELKQVAIHFSDNEIKIISAKIITDQQFLEQNYIKSEEIGNYNYYVNQFCSENYKFPVNLFDKINIVKNYDQESVFEELIPCCIHDGILIYLFQSQIKSIPNSDNLNISNINSIKLTYVEKVIFEKLISQNTNIVDICGVINLYRKVISK